MWALRALLVGGRDRLMRIGYLFRGFLGDVKLGPDLREVSTPDGNATYSWSIEHECERRGYKLIPLGPNLDAPAAGQLGGGLFSAFSGRKRLLSYERMLVRGWTRLSDVKLPELDLVLIEWRWPIPGRNTPQDRGSPDYQNDLERQTAVLRHYMKRGIPVVVWDLDHKLQWHEEDMWGLNRIIETAVRPLSRSPRARQGDAYHLPPRVRVEPPFVTADLLQHDIDERRPSHHLGYVGSRYERDETIDRWIGPITPPRTHRAKFWGKWEPADEVRARWPGITFAGRIGVNGFREAYSRVAAVPLLAKQSYYESGFITPRPWEAVLFGSVPVGLACHLGVYQYVDRVVGHPQGLLDVATELRNVSPIRRRVIREEAAHMLSRVDVRNFVDVLEGLVGDAVVGETAPKATARDVEARQGRDVED